MPPTPLSAAKTKRLADRATLAASAGEKEKEVKDPPQKETNDEKAERLKTEREERLERNKARSTHMCLLRKEGSGTLEEFKEEIKKSNENKEAEGKQEEEEKETEEEIKEKVNLKEWSGEHANEEEVGGETDVETGPALTEENEKRIQSKINNYINLLNFKGQPHLKGVVLRKAVIEIELLVLSSLDIINKTPKKGEDPTTFNEFLEFWGKISPGGREGVSVETGDYAEELLAPVIDTLQKNDKKGVYATIALRLSKMMPVTDQCLERCQRIYPALACGARTGQLFFRALMYNFKRASALSPAAREILDKCMKLKQAQAFKVTDLDFNSPEDINREALKDALWTRHKINMTGQDAHIYFNVSEPAYLPGGDRKYRPDFDLLTPAVVIISGYQGRFPAVPTA